MGYFCGFSICLQRLFDTIIPLQYAEKMRQNIEPCDIDGDIQLYIKYHKTGSEKPRKYRKSPVKGKSIVKYSIHVLNGSFMYIASYFKVALAARKGSIVSVFGS